MKARFVLHGMDERTPSEREHFVWMASCPISIGRGHEMVAIDFSVNYGLNEIRMPIKSQVVQDVVDADRLNDEPVIIRDTARRRLTVVSVNSIVYRLNDHLGRGRDAR